MRLDFGRDEANCKLILIGRSCEHIATGQSAACCTKWGWMARPSRHAARRTQPRTRCFRARSFPIRDRPCVSPVHCRAIRAFFPNAHDQRQVWRYLRQFPSPCSPNRSLFRQACLNSPQTSLRAGLWHISRYLRQLPSPCSPRTSLYSQARRNCSHCPPRPTRMPPGPTSIDWEKADIGINKSAAAHAAANKHLRISLNIPNPPTRLSLN